jgi:hypothetical protein
MGIPSGYYWGVDSYNPIHKPSGGKTTLFDYVKEQTGATPSFWGRYLVGADGSTVTQAEVDFLAKTSPNTRLLLVYDMPNRVGGGTVVGRSDAQAAIQAANDLKVPDNVIIYADLEPADGKVSPDWIVGWWTVMAASRFGRGGLYGNTASTFWKAYLEPAYSAAIKIMPSPGRDRPLWGMYPLHTKGKDRGDRHIPYRPNEIDFSYEPGSLPSQLGDPIVWQYDIDCFIPNKGKLGLCDMDLASQDGFDGMWKVTPTFFPPTDDDLKKMVQGWSN